MKSTKTMWAITATGVIMSLAVAAPAFAETTQQEVSQRGWGSGMMRVRVPGVFGTVTAIGGSTITVVGKAGPNGAAATTYTVNAANASVMKDAIASALSGIAVGDTVMIEGTVSGTDVTATVIHDGQPRGRMMGARLGGGMHNPSIAGNGQPIIGGSITAVSGNTLTVANKGNAVYTVDASSATIMKAGATSTIASIATGDNVIVQGAVNGTSVVAAFVHDRGATPVAPAAGTESTAKSRGLFGDVRGMFGGFLHLFGL